MKLFCAFKAGKLQRLSNYQKFLIRNVFTFLCTKAIAVTTINFYFPLKAWIFDGMFLNRVSNVCCSSGIVFVREKHNNNCKIIPQACKMCPYLKVLIFPYFNDTIFVN